MPLRPLTAQIVGSYAKPHWLARHERMRAHDDSFWRPEREVLHEARQDAARLAIYEQERAGLDIVTDGEAQRAAYDQHFLRALTNIDFARSERRSFAGEVTTVSRREDLVKEYADLSEMLPRVTGDIGWQGPVALEELKFLKSVARKPVKASVVGALTLSTRLADDFYHDDEALVLAIAGALNSELLALQAGGADVLQIDEPSFHFKLSSARRFGKAAIARMTAGITVPVIVHVCYGYALVFRDKSASPTYPEVLELLADCPIAGISLEYEQPKHAPSLLRHCGDKHVLLGLLDLSISQIETVGHITRRMRAALEVVPAERLHPSSDCGMWYKSREIAFGKISALAQATAMVRKM
jgi:5-methyltetrahydropteroyltriglutamate--homocysteine methyltransferase